MQYATLENTQARVSRIAFGTASLHHLFSAKQRQALLAAAASAGISHFDTSPYYGCGLAESDLGVFMQARRGDFTLATKVGLYPYGGAASSAGSVWGRKVLGKIHPRLSAPVVDWSLRRAGASLNASLGRLKTDYVDFLFLHEPDMGLINADEFLRWLEAEQSSGKIRYWGLAGLPALLAPWLRAGHPFSRVLQTQDDVEAKTADFLLAHGRGLQFTYGYLSSRLADNSNPSPAMRIAKALERNTGGSVIVSTRRLGRIAELAEAAP